MRHPANHHFHRRQTLGFDTCIEISYGGMQVFYAKEFLDVLAERVIICRARISVLVVDKSAGQKACCEGSCAFNSVLSPSFIVAP